MNSYLKSKGVPEDSYSINEVNDESLCIVEENKKWHIFYSERGLRTEEYCCQDEHLAILYFINRLSKMLKFSFEWKKQTVACMKLLIMVWGMCVTYMQLLLFKRHLNLLWRRLSYRFFNNFITDWCRVRLKTYFQATSTKFLSCWLHHKLRLQRPLTTKLMAQLHCPKRRHPAFRQPRQPNPAADYRVQTWWITKIGRASCRERV